MWGPGASGGFQNALQTGLQLGQIARQNQQQNALMQQRDQALAQQQAEFEAAQQAAAQKAAMQQQTQDLTGKWLSGDEAAGDELARVNLDAWKGLNPEVKARATEQAQIFGNASLQLLNVPYEQRRGQIIAFAQRFPDLANQINELAYLPANEQDAALRAVVAEAKLTEKLISMERPDYQTIPEGGTLVNTRDPQAVAQFQGGATATGGFVEGQTATNPTTGQRIVFRNGAWRPM